MAIMTLREHCRTIFQAGLKAVDPGAAVGGSVLVQEEILRVGGTAYDLREVDQIFVVGMGKASAAMAQPLEEELGSRISNGVVVVKYGHGLPLHRVRVLEAGHPVPDRAGADGAAEIIRVLGAAGPHDLILCLISGGGSALSPAPASGVSLEDKQAVTRLLLASGATIHEINTVRKHLSRLKGGQLSRHAHPARVISLVLSDVVGDDLDVIASGPTVADPTTFLDAVDALTRRAIRQEVPSSVAAHLQAGLDGRVPETPKPGEPILERTRNRIVGSNRMALEAAAGKARAMGYRVLTPPGLEEGEARTVAAAHVELARAVRDGPSGPPLPVCLLTGGEVTVTLSGQGKGGRNQEFALAAALEMEGLEDTVLLSAGTDGTDGPTDAAGAMVDPTTVLRGREAGLDPEAFLEKNDSYHFFQALGDLFITGPTRTNVMDLRIVLLD